jgi:hypothetical protein
MGSLRAYKRQIAIEPELQLIVGQAVTQQTNDKKQLLPMIDIVKQQCGQKIRAGLTDRGYCPEENLRLAAMKKGRPLEKQKYDQSPVPCCKELIPKSATLVHWMTRKLQTRTSGPSAFCARRLGRLCVR